MMIIKLSDVISPDAWERPEPKPKKPPRILLTPEEKKERAKAACRNYYERNREERRARARWYASVNRDKYRIYHARWRARKSGANGAHDWSDVQRKWQEQKGLCALCGEFMHDGFHVDHIRPLSKGGSDAPDNIQLACPPCNISKGNRISYPVTEIAENQ